MALYYENLDENVRRYMIHEIETDFNEDRLYFSPRLNHEGRRHWHQILIDAATHGNDASLAERLAQYAYLNLTEQRRNPKGGAPIVAKIPVNAAEVLAEGEFNRFYVRGLCRFAIDSGISRLEVYRGKQVTNPRAESREKIGQHYDPRLLLKEVRDHIGVDTALGMPQGPNSGLTLRLPAGS